MIHQQTKLKILVLLMGLVTLLAVLKHFMSGIPFGEAVAAIGGAYTVYATTKTIADKNNGGPRNGSTGP